jgi:hypothetical protein
MTTIIITVGMVAIVAVMLIIKFAGVQSDEFSKPKASNTGSDISGDKPADKGKPNIINK